MDEQKYCKSQKEAAVYANVTPRTIRRWENKGLTRTKEGYLKSDLHMFIERKIPAVVKIPRKSIEGFAGKVEAEMEGLSKLKMNTEELLKKKPGRKSPVVRVPYGVIKKFIGELTTRTEELSKLKLRIGVESFGVYIKKSRQMELLVNL